MKIIASGLRFPEGPVAMGDGSVILVEIERGSLTRVQPDGRIEVLAQLGGGPNGVAIGPGNAAFVCNNGGFEWIRNGHLLRSGPQSRDYETGRIEVVDLATGKFERLYERCDGRPLKGPNDIVFDSTGGFWFTDLGKRRDRELDLGGVYWARADGSEIREVVHGMVTANGIGLSPDEKTLYVAETITGRLWSWEILGPGQLRKRVWPAQYGATLVAGVGGGVRFDSLAVTQSGNICVAALDSCAVVEIEPHGRKVVHHAMPDLLVTNLCFGGADMKTAFVTLSHDGRLVAADWPDAGLRLNYQQ
ncbi:SMP-30/gluconolactonase/LRE family protein [Acidisoma cellulosilytica]|uniref:SMP-30/gluconolactonase/LRE family protein n=1 Tax=Acidisoma cellulosilyticum TaxID=2802395 RepID=A0A964E6K0_9PROT|nr:SMP-30/gluconolactonase/LRE family protein [Acidisoma cellulosilyticum]MCB8883098.1 SMP-30/gluconolactonase/LRE family protein [Acidisoma cellulosilyticum]